MSYCLMSLESNEKLTGIRIYLKPLKISLLLTLFGSTLEESGVVQQILRQPREGPGLPYTIWMQKTQGVESLLGMIL